MRIRTCLFVFFISSSLWGAASPPEIHGVYSFTIHAEAKYLEKDYGDRYQLVVGVENDGIFPLTLVLIDRGRHDVLGGSHSTSGVMRSDGSIVFYDTTVHDNGRVATVHYVGTYDEQTGQIFGFADMFIDGQHSERRRSLWKMIKQVENP